MDSTPNYFYFKKAPTIEYTNKEKKKSLPLLENNQFNIHAIPFQLKYPNTWRSVSSGIPVSSHRGTESEAGMFSACMPNPP